MLTARAAQWDRWGQLGPTAKVLGCTEELASIERIFEHSPSYVRQRELFATQAGFNGLIDHLSGELRDDLPWERAALSNQS